MLLSLVSFQKKKDRSLFESHITSFQHSGLKNCHEKMTQKISQNQLSYHKEQPNTVKSEQHSHAREGGPTLIAINEWSRSELTLNQSPRRVDHSTMSVVLNRRSGGYHCYFRNTVSKIKRLVVLIKMPSLANDDKN